MVRSTQGTPLCVLHFALSHFGIWQCMVYGVASMVLPATAPTGTSPPTVRPAERHTASCVACMACVVRGTVAPGTSMQYTVSLFLRRMSPFYTLHVVLQLLLEYKVQASTSCSSRVW